MKHENSYLRFALGFINIILVVFGISLILVSILLTLNVTSLDLFGHGTISISEQESSLITRLVSFLNSGILFAVLVCVRQFFKNILAEQIFVDQNIKLAKLVALLLLITAFLGEGILTFNGYTFSST